MKRDGLYSQINVENGIALMTLNVILFLLANMLQKETNGCTTNMGKEIWQNVTIIVGK